MRFAQVTGAALLLSALPLAAFAQSTSSTPDISALLAEITALEQQITSLAGASSTPATPASPAPESSGPETMCPSLTRTLSFGSSGADVASLQTFLGISPATGYFGSITQNAVEQWQAQNGVVSSGTPATTGYGVVGPHTEAAIGNACGAATPQATQCISTQPPQTECSAGWQPVTDAAGCTEYYQCTVALPTASPGASTSATPAVSTTSCPAVVQPQCSGSVVPFQTNSNGCVIAYECVL